MILTPMPEVKKKQRKRERENPKKSNKNREPKERKKNWCSYLQYAVVLREIAF
jgi:hypothetical protein